ncbi:MAG: pilus assembly protein CpaF [Bradymonadia bacterium]|jgi:pilus assembly protein CpaF
MFEVSVHERGLEPVVLRFNKPEITVGRAGGNDVVLRRNSVSKAHVKVIARGGRFIAVDMGSTNGTIVAGQKISAPRLVEELEKVVVGDYVLTFRDAPTDSSATSGVAARAAAAMRRPDSPVEPAVQAVSSMKEETQDENDATTSLAALLDDVGAHAEAGLGSERLTATAAVSMPSMPTPLSLDSRISLDSYSPGSTLMMRPPADLFRDPGSGASPVTKTDAASLAIVATPEFAEHYTQALESLLQVVPTSEFPTNYPPAEADITRFRSLASELATGVDGDSRAALIDAVVHAATGLGPIEFYLDDDSISEVHVNSFNTIFARRDGQLERTHLGFIAPEVLAATARRIMVGADLADPSGGSVRLPDGTRLELVMPPTSTAGPILTIRKPLIAKSTMSDLIDEGMLSAEIANSLQVAARHGGSIIIATQSPNAATRLVNALVNDLPESMRVVSVETDAGLSPTSDAVVRLEHHIGQLPTAVARALSIEPDVLVVDSLADDLAGDWLAGASSRTCSTIATVASRNPNDALARLTLLAGAGRSQDSRAIARKLGANLDLLLQLHRRSGGGAIVSEVVEVVVGDGGDLSTASVFRSKNGPSGVEFTASGHVPALFAALSEAGEEFDGSIFNA